ncbi:TPA: colicin release lysis protein [Escherichia coli]
MRQQQDEPGRFSICSRQAAVVQGGTVAPSSSSKLTGIAVQ